MLDQSTLEDKSGTHRYENITARKTLIGKPEGRIHFRKC
jgi:hypothetical protein